MRVGARTQKGALRTDLVLQLADSPSQGSSGTITLRRMLLLLLAVVVIVVVVGCCCWMLLFHLVVELCCLVC
jgi:hypothetical protein